MEHRFVLLDFTARAAAGRPRLYEAGHSYPMPAAVAHAAARRDLVALQAHALAPAEHPRCASCSHAHSGGPRRLAGIFKLAFAAHVGFEAGRVAIQEPGPFASH